MPLRRRHKYADPIRVLACRHLDIPTKKRKLFFIDSKIKNVYLNNFIAIQLRTVGVRIDCDEYNTTIGVNSFALNKSIVQIEQN